MNRIRSFFYQTLRPDMYHGHHKKPPFFEGWYFKVVSADESHRYAIIPGVFLGDDGHAFVQILNGMTAESIYHRFPLESFWASEEDFEVRIGENVFYRQHINLNIDRPEGQLIGELRFSDLVVWPVSAREPGIMGWYAWVPLMECYHGVISLDHQIMGSLKIDGESIDFSSGRGYTEKDWGQSFPSAYIWMQSNHFSNHPVCLTGSVAMIPWVRQAFRGFIIGLWYRGELYRFATYNGAIIEHLELENDHVDWYIRGKNHRLELHATRPEGGLLHAPDRESMLQRVEETMRATVDVQLLTLEGQVIFEDRGRHAGLEVFGDLERLLATA